MRIYSELDLNTFEAWSGAVSTLDRIREENKCSELENILEELYPDGMDETELNDLLWFEEEQVFEWLGIRGTDAVENELEEAREELAELMEYFANDIDDEDLTEEEKEEIWESNYKDDVEELKERIAELEEELENL